MWGACSVISTTNNGNGSYTLNLPDGVELEEGKIYYVKFSPTTASASYNVKLNNKNVYSMPYYDTSKVIKYTKMLYKGIQQYCFGTTNPVLPLMYTTNGFYVVGEHIIAGYYDSILSKYNNSGVYAYIKKKYNVYTSGRADFFNNTWSTDAAILTASSSDDEYYPLTFKDSPHVEISCWGKDANNIPRMVLTSIPTVGFLSYKVLDRDVYGYSIKAEGIVF